MLIHRFEVWDELKHGANDGRSFYSNGHLQTEAVKPSKCRGLKHLHDGE
jgi:hypothetical protein